MTLRVHDAPRLLEIAGLNLEQETARRVHRPIVVDTMSSATSDDSTTFTPSKPRLGASPVYRFINLSDRLYQDGLRTIDIKSQALELEEQSLSSLVKEHVQKLTEAAKRAQESGVWSYLQKIGSAILSTVSIFLGINLSATAATATIGTAIIGVGILGLANLAFKEAGFWDWVAEKIAHDNEEQKKKIQNLAPFILGLLVNGAQLAAFGALPAFAGMDLATKALFIAQVASNSATMVSAVGGQISEAFVAKAKAEALSLQGDMQLSRHEVERITQGVENALSSQANAYKAAKHLVELSVEANHQILSV